MVDDESQETWLRRASLGASALKFMVDLFFDVADVLDELEAVTMNNPIVEACDMFPATPPDGVLAQGEITISPDDVVIISGGFALIIQSP